MSHLNLMKRAAAVVASAAIGMSATAAVASASSGVSSTLLTSQPFNEAVQMNAGLVKFQTKGDTIVRVQSFTWNANSTSGWHHHPGVIMGVVTSGTITIWSPTCGQKTYGPGQPLGAVFVEGDNQLMQATSSGGATEYVVHVVPVGVAPRAEDDVPACASGTAFRVPKGE